MPAHLFRRHVGDRSDDGAAHRRQLRRRLARSKSEQLCEAEIENLQPAVIQQEQVLRFEITVEDAVLVRGSQSLREL